MGTNTQTTTTGTERKVSQLMGDGHFRLGRYGAAIGHYRASGDIERVIACGNECLSRGQLADGITAYEAVGRIIPPELLIACGDMIVRGPSYAHHSDQAVAAYALAGASDRLIALGEKLLDLGTMKGHWKLAVPAYIASGVAKRIRVIAQACLSQGFIGHALDAFAAIGDKKGLVATGALAQKEGETDLAIKAFEAAGSWQSLIDLGDNRLKAGYDERAQVAYEAAARIYAQQLPAKS